MRGGARRPRARRTLCTSSVRPRAPTKQMGPFQRPERGGGLRVDEIRRPPVQEARASCLRPGDEPVERLAPEKGPHRRAMDEEALDVLGPELVAVMLA